MKKLLYGKKLGDDVGKAEVKMSLVVMYYVVVGTTSLATFTHIEVREKTNRKRLTELILCESAGRKDSDCGLDLTDLDAANILSTISITMMATLPAVLLLFSLDLKAVKRKQKKASGRVVSRKSSSSLVSRKSSSLQ